METAVKRQPRPDVGRGKGARVKALRADTISQVSRRVTLTVSGQRGRPIDRRKLIRGPRHRTGGGSFGFSLHALVEARAATKRQRYVRFYGPAKPRPRGRILQSDLGGVKPRDLAAPLGKRGEVLRDIGTLSFENEIVSCITSVESTGVAAVASQAADPARLRGTAPGRREAQAT